jgi:hypothetical protein
MHARYVHPPLHEWGCFTWRFAHTASTLDCRVPRATYAPPLLQPDIHWRLQLGASHHLRAQEVHQQCIVATSALLLLRQTGVWLTVAKHGNSTARPQRGHITHRSRLLKRRERTKDDGMPETVPRICPARPAAGDAQAHRRFARNPTYRFLVQVGQCSHLEHNLHCPTHTSSAFVFYCFTSQVHPGWPSSAVSNRHNGCTR